MDNYSGLSIQYFVFFMSMNRENKVTARFTVPMRRNWRTGQPCPEVLESECSRYGWRKVYYIITLKGFT